MIFVKAKSWEEIERFFAELTSADEYFLPMLEFVSLIKNSIYAIGLYPATSMHSLLISQSETFEFRHQVLKIELQKSKFHFLYSERHVIKPLLELESSYQRGFETLEYFLKRRKWFLKSTGEIK